MPSLNSQTVGLNKFFYVEQCSQDELSPVYPLCTCILCFPLVATRRGKDLKILLSARDLSRVPTSRHDFIICCKFIWWKMELVYGLGVVRSELHIYAHFKEGGGFSSTCNRYPLLPILKLFSNYH